MASWFPYTILCNFLLFLKEILVAALLPHCIF